MPVRSHAFVWFVALTGLTLSATPSRAEGASDRCAAPPGSGTSLLSLDLESLLEIKVTSASKFEQSLADAPGVVTVIGADDLRRFGGTTLREILDRVPGLTLTANPVTDRSMIAARGNQTRVTGGHVLFLVDGRPTREVLDGGIATDLLESFPVAALERIEVVKGPGSVLYGSNAYSGVVNLITLQAEENGANTAALGGSNGALNLAGMGHISCGSFRLLGAAQFRRADDWSTPYEYSPLFGLEPGTTVAAIPDRNPSFFAKAEYRGLRATSMFTETTSASFMGDVKPARWRRGFGDVSYSRAFGTAWDATVSGSYTRNTLFTTSLPFSAADSQELVLEWTNAMRASSRTTITAGGLYGYLSGHEDFHGVTPAVRVSDARRHSGAFYAQGDYRLAHWISAIGGFQANKLGSIDLDLVPRVGLIVKPTDHLNAKVFWGQAFRGPGITETKIQHPTGLVGNPQLKPERTSAFDMALTYRGDAVEGTVAYFRTSQTNTIQIVPGEGPDATYENIGEARFSGFETEGKFYVNKSLYVVGSTLYQQNEDGEGVRNITPTPNFSAKFGVSYQTDLVTASVFDSYQSSVTGQMVTANPPPDALHLINAHLRLDVSRLVRAGSVGALALVVHVNNLGNTEVWRPWGSGFLDTLPTDRGRTIYIGAQVGVGRGAVR